MVEKPSRRLIPTRAVCARYGVVDRTIDRWVADPKLGFAQPIYINNRRYFDEEQLEEFERRRRVTSKMEAA